MGVALHTKREETAFAFELAIASTSAERAEGAPLAPHETIGIDELRLTRTLARSDAKRAGPCLQPRYQKTQDVARVTKAQALGTPDAVFTLFFGRASSVFHHSRRPFRPPFHVRTSPGFTPPIPSHVVHSDTHISLHATSHGPTPNLASLSQLLPQAHSPESRLHQSHVHRKLELLPTDFSS